MNSYHAILQQDAGSGLLPLAQLAALLGVIALLGVALVALLVLGYTFFPHLVARAQSNIEQTPGRSFVVGLVNVLFFALLALALAAGGGIFALLGLLLISALLALVGLGLAAVALLGGSRLRRGGDDPARVAAGAGLLLLAALVPVVGWFVVVPLSVCCGLGAVVSALLRRGEKTHVTGTINGDLL